MKTLKSENMTLTLPTNPRGPGAAKLVYSFSDRIFNREFQKFVRKNRFDSLPPEFVVMLRAELERVEEALLRAVGESVVAAIRAGGVMSKIAGYSSGRAVFRPMSGRAGSRIFRIRSGRLSGAVDYSVLNGTLEITWNTGVIAGQIPGPYRSPIDISVPEAGLPLLEELRQRGVPSAPTNPVAAIESGDPSYQRQTTPGNYGFHPFEGAVKKNVSPLEISYAQAVRDIFERGVFVYGGRKLPLPVYVDKLFADAIQDFYKTDIQPNRSKIAPVKELKSNESVFFNYLKKLFPGNSVFVRTLSFGDVRAIFQRFGRGRSKSVSRGNVGIKDSEFADQFVRDSRRSIQKFLEQIGDDI